MMKQYKKNFRKNGDVDQGSDNLLLIFGPLIFVLLMVNCVFGKQTHPTVENLDNVELEVYMPPNELPEYLVPLTNERGMTVTRVSDLTLFPNTQQLGHNYSSDQPWNSDGTLIKLSGYPAAILDGETYEFLFWANISGYGRWFNNNPNFIYGISQNKFVVLDVITNTPTTLHTFEQYNSIDLGYGEGNADLNDKYVALIGDNTTIFVYDMQEDVVVGSLDIPAGDLDKFYVSPLGNYVILDWRINGNGPTQGLKRYNIDMTNGVHLSDFTAHSDTGLLENNDEVIVKFGNESNWSNDYYIEMIKIGTGETVGLFHWPHDLHGGFFRNLGR